MTAIDGMGGEQNAVHHSEGEGTNLSFFPSLLIPVSLAQHTAQEGKSWEVRTKREKEEMIYGFDI